MPIDDDLPDVVLTRGERVRTEKEIARPALVRTGRELGRREQREQHEQAEREADAVRPGEDADYDAERREEHGQERPDEQAGRQGIADDSDTAAEKPDVRDRDPE